MRNDEEKVFNQFMWYKLLKFVVLPWSVIVSVVVTTQSSGGTFRLNRIRFKILIWEHIPDITSS